MNIPDAFDRMKVTVAQVMDHFSRHGYEPAAQATAKRMLITGVQGIEDVAYSVMGEPGGKGNYRVVAEFKSGGYQTPVGHFISPVSAVLQAPDGNKVALVIGEPHTGRMWSRSLHQSLKHEVLEFGSADRATDAP